jgi:hypothetical protein
MFAWMRALRKRWRESRLVLGWVVDDGLANFNKELEIVVEDEATRARVVRQIIDFAGFSAKRYLPKSHTLVLITNSTVRIKVRDQSGPPIHLPEAADDDSDATQPRPTVGRAA